MMVEVNQQLFDELCEYLRIPSISTGDANPQGLRQAADWLVDRIAKSNGVAELVETAGNPIVVGELAGRNEQAPTVLVYGHYDVQSPGDENSWDSAPFEPEIRGDRLYARGAADNKGNFYPVFYTACQMSLAGDLPVNIRFCIEGEEEVGSGAALQWMKQDPRGADCCIIFDSGSLVGDDPAITLGTRGMVALRVDVHVGDRDLHSGLYGGIFHNANHVLIRMLSELLPDSDGLLRKELREGLEPISDEEVKSWRTLPKPSSVVGEVGGLPLSAEVIDRYYQQNWADTSLDVNWLSGGDRRTVIPSVASAFLSLRIGPGQDAETINTTVKRLIHEATPPGATTTVKTEGLVDAAWFDPDEPALKIARESFERVTGRSPLLIRLGATLPLMAPLQQREIPTILSGFSVQEDAFHAPNESYRLEALRLGEATSRELFTGLASLESRGRPR